MDAQGLLVRRLGLVDYAAALTAMQELTARRGTDTPDEIWLLQHPPVFTLGQAGRPEHILDAGEIPVVRSDRGGQVTFHGPGQLLAYLLLDLRRRRLGIRELVTRMEDAVIALLAAHQLSAHARPEAPGVYVGAAKIASLGLRVRDGCCYHGLSLNVHMDLTAFRRINPCGYPGLPVTQIADLTRTADLDALGVELAAQLTATLGYNSHRILAPNHLRRQAETNEHVSGAP
jgi:lipoyl(octanoyl) transferase